MNILKALGITLISFSLLIIGTVFAAFVLFPIFDLDNTNRLALYLATMVGHLLMLGFGLYLFTKKQLHKTLDFSLQSLLKGVYYGLPLLALIFIQLSLSPINPLPLLSMLFLILVFIIVAINEEILVRGVILEQLKPHHQPIFAAIASSVIFSLMHLGTYGQTDLLTLAVTLMTLAFLFGVPLAIIRLKTNSILGPIVIHFLNNCLAILSMGLELEVPTATIPQAVFASGIALLLTLGYILFFKRHQDNIMPATDET